MAEAAKLRARNLRRDARADSDFRDAGFDKFLGDGVGDALALFDDYVPALSE